VLHNAATAFLYNSSFNGGSNCGATYNNFTAAGLAYIEAQAESCESGDPNFQCGGNPQ
jgi:hypothetical protein